MFKILIAAKELPMIHKLMAETTDCDFKQAVEIKSQKVG